MSSIPPGKRDDQADATDEKTIVGGYTNTLKIKIQEAADAPPAVVLLTGPSRQIGKQWQILKTHMIVGRAIESDILSTINPSVVSMHRSL